MPDSPPTSKSRSKNFIKGDIAEGIVSSLFRALSYQVFANGIETTRPELLILRQKNLIDGLSIRKDFLQPDFIMVREHDANRRGGRFDIEVKYSRHGQIETEKLLRYAEDTHFVLLDTQNFWSVSKSAVKLLSRQEEKYLAFGQFCRLEDDTVFAFTPEEKDKILQHKDYLVALRALDAQKASAAKVEPNKTAPPHAIKRNKRENASAANYGKTWHKDDLERLASEYLHLAIRHESSQVVTMLSHEFGRTINGIVFQLQNLGLIEKK